MYFFEITSLTQLCIPRILELLWNSKSISSSLYQVIPAPKSGKEFRKDQLKNIAEAVRNNLVSLAVPGPLYVALSQLVEPLGMQLLDWINFLNYEFQSTTDHSIIYTENYFLNHLVWTNLGTINKKLSADKIILCKEISTPKRYELACVFCCQNELTELWNQSLTGDQRTSLLTLFCTDTLDLSGEKLNPLFAYWTFLLAGEMGKIAAWREDDKNINEHLALWSIMNNNQDAFLYFWMRMTEEERYRNIVHFVDVSSTFNSMNCFSRGAQINRNRRYLYMSDYAQLYANINAFLLMQLQEHQLTEILTNNAYNFIMSFYLHWLWHDNFVRIVTNWVDFTDGDIEALLMGVIDRQPSPQDLRKYKAALEIFIKKNTAIFRRCILIANCKGFWKILAVKDSNILKLVLNILNANEKNKIINSNFGVAQCSDLIMKGQFDYLDVFLEGALIFDEDKDNFRKNLFQSKDSLSNYLLLENKFDLFLKFVQWSTVSEEDVELYKSNLLDEGQVYFIVKVLLVSHDSLETVDSFVSWCFNSSVERIDRFKHEIVENETAISYCAKLLNNEKFNVAKGFLMWCGLSQEETENVLKDLLNEFVTVMSEYHK